MADEPKDAALEAFMKSVMDGPPEKKREEDAKAAEPAVSENEAPALPTAAVAPPVATPAKTARPVSSVPAAKKPFAPKGPPAPGLKTGVFAAPARPVPVAAAAPVEAQATGVAPVAAMVAPAVTAPRHREAAATPTLVLASLALTALALVLLVVVLVMLGGVKSALTGQAQQIREIRVATDLAVANAESAAKGAQRAYESAAFKFTAVQDPQKGLVGIIVDASKAEGGKLPAYKSVPLKPATP